MTTSLITQRVIYNGSDISVAMNSYRDAHYVVNYQPGQYFYIGSTVPFTHLWIELIKQANHTPGAPIIEIWFNNSWKNAVDIIDGTNQISKSGRISWATEIESGWEREQKSIDVGLTNTAIYNKYWMRMSWASHFDAHLYYFGQKFSDDTVLASMYPDLLQPAILTGFKTGKTNWDEQHFMAAEAIVKEVRKRNFALDRGQLMDWTIFEDAACHKVAEIVYQAFGAPYQDHVAKANKRYNDEMNTRFMVVDVNANGHVEQDEITRKSGYLTR
jgi:hypothetical protein